MNQNLEEFQSINQQKVINAEFQAYKLKFQRELSQKTSSCKELLQTIRQHLKFISSNSLKQECNRLGDVIDAPTVTLVQPIALQNITVLCNYLDEADKVNAGLQLTETSLGEAVRQYYNAKLEGAFLDAYVQYHDQEARAAGKQQELHQLQAKIVEASVQMQGQTPRIDLVNQMILQGVSQTDQNCVLRAFDQNESTSAKKERAPVKPVRTSNIKSILLNNTQKTAAPQHGEFKHELVMLCMAYYYVLFV